MTQAVGAPGQRARLPRGRGVRIDQDHWKAARLGVTAARLARQRRLPPLHEALIDDNLFDLALVSFFDQPKGDEKNERVCVTTSFLVGKEGLEAG